MRSLSPDGSPRTRTDRRHDSSSVIVPCMANNWFRTAPATETARPGQSSARMGNATSPPAMKKPNDATSKQADLLDIGRRDQGPSPSAHDRSPHRVRPVTTGFGAGLVVNIAPPANLPTTPSRSPTVQVIDPVAPKATLIPDTLLRGRMAGRRSRSNRPTANVVVATRLRTSRVVPSLSLAVDQLPGSS